MHLDLYTSVQQRDVTRLEGLGATRIPWQYAEGHDQIVMADLDGNEFCVVQSPYTQG